MKRHIKMAFCVVLALITLAGCTSKELSRSKAKKLIEKQLGDGKIVGDLYSGFVVTEFLSFDELSSFKVTKHITSNDYKLMQNSGLVELQDMGYAMLGKRFIVTFPEDVKKKYVISTESKEKFEMDGRSYSKDVSKVLLGKVLIKEITGIVQEGKDIGAKAKVEFVLHMEASPFGKFMLSDLMQEGDNEYIAKCERYDDGWRIIKENGMMPAKIAKDMEMGIGDLW